MVALKHHRTSLAEFFEAVFQPVAENVLPADDKVTVRSAMPGRVLSGK